MADRGDHDAPIWVITMAGIRRLVICTTPAYSPESNGMAESFVKTFKRDYVYVNQLHDAASVMRQLAAWFEDYNEAPPHKCLGMQSPREYQESDGQRLA